MFHVVPEQSLNQRTANIVMFDHKALEAIVRPSHTLPQVFFINLVLLYTFTLFGFVLHYHIQQIKKNTRVLSHFTVKVALSHVIRTPRSVT